MKSWDKEFKVSKNHAMDIQLDWRTELCSWFAFTLQVTNSCDHAGIYFNVSLFKLFWFGVSIFDMRYYDD